MIPLHATPESLMLLVEQTKEHITRSKGRDNIQECFIAWEKPPDAWTKINVRGASEGNPGRAGMGWLIREDCGRWKAGFSVFLGG